MFLYANRITMSALLKNSEFSAYSNHTCKSSTLDSFMLSLDILRDKKSEDLSGFHWIPKLHNNPYNQRQVAGSSSYSTKQLSYGLLKSYPL